jgi:Fic family protein
MVKNNFKIARARAGSYVFGQDGIRSFRPSDLPPDPPLEIDERMMSLLSAADIALGRLDGLAEILPDTDMFVMMYIRKEAVLSSQIEGTQASLLDVIGLESDVLDPGRAKDVSEVINYIKALNLGLEKQTKGSKLNMDLVCQMHKVLLKDVRGGRTAPGCTRKVQNWVGPPGAGIEKATYVPPCVKDMEKALEGLEDFIDAKRPIPPLIKAGMVHSQFETIHPFIDGNGRMGRLLITMILMDEGVLQRPFLYLSHHFKRNRREYYERLQAVRDDGDWEGWIRFFLQGVRDVSAQAIGTSKSIISLKADHTSRIKDKIPKGTGRALDLLDDLYKKPVVSIETVKKVTGLSFSSANNLTHKFVGMGILKEISGRKKGRIFECSDYLKLLSD